MISDKYNDVNFNPDSKLLGEVWHEFGVPIDISYDSVVVKMGELTEQKAKDKVTSLRAKLNICICDHKASGNGDGTRNFLSCDETPEVDMEVCDDRANFVRAGTTPAILYLWELARNSGILHSVTQRITEGHSVDGGTAPSVMGDKRGSKKRKKKGREDTEMDNFQIALGARLDDASYQMATSNLLALREKLDALEGNVIEMEEEAAILELDKNDAVSKTRLTFRKRRIQKEMETIKIVKRDINKVLETMSRIEKGRKPVQDSSSSQSTSGEEAVEEVVVIDEEEEDENEKDKGSNDESDDESSSSEDDKDDE